MKQKKIMLLLLSISLSIAGVLILIGSIGDILLCNKVGYLFLLFGGVMLISIYFKYIRRDK